MTESPVSASATLNLRRRSAMVFVIASSPRAPSLAVSRRLLPRSRAVRSSSVDDEAEITGRARDRIDAARDAIEAVHAAEQRGLGIGRRREAVVGSRQL